MTHHFHIDTTAESPAYHGAQGPQDYTAALITPRIAGDAGDAAELGAAITLLQTGQFWLVQLAETGGTWQATGLVWPVTPGFAPFAQPEVDKATAALFEWLAKRKPAGNVPFYSGDHEREVDLSRAKAHDLLRAASLWPAPLPQRLGLVALLRHDTVGVGEVWVPVLLPAGAKADFSDIVVEDSRLDDAGSLIPAVFQLTHTPTGWVFHSERLSPYATPDGKPEAETAFAANGLIRFDSQDGALHAFKARVEAAGPTRLAAYPALLNLFSGPAVAPALLTQTDREALRQAGLTVLFDTILCGLLLPLSAGRRLSRVMALLQAHLVEAFEIEQPDRPNPLSDARAIVTALSGALSSAVTSQDWLIKTADEAFKSDSRFAPVFAVAAAMPDQPWSEVAAWLSGLLSPLATEVETEDGTERFVLALLGKGIGSLPEDPASRPLPVLTRAIREFGAQLKGSFDTAGALRADAGAEMALALLATSSTVPLAFDALRAANGFRSRFRPLAEAAAVGDLLSALYPVPAPLPDTLRDGLPDWMAVVAAEFDTLTPPVFRPDTAPQPLAIRVLPGLAPKAAGLISEGISGFGVLVAAQSDATSMALTAHVSLVGLEANPDLKTAMPDFAATVLPGFPALSQGTAEMFIAYAGHPLASPNLPGSRHDSANAGEAPTQPFKLKEAAMEGLTLPPALAYGASYGAQAFWVAQSGALPFALRQSGKPFVPGPPLAPFQPATGQAWLRRTAIGQSLTQAGKGPLRLGQVPKGVYPMTLDLPRWGLGGAQGGQRWMDLFRRADGSGLLTASMGSKALRLPAVDLVGITVSQDGTVPGLMMDWMAPGQTGAMTLTFDPAAATLTATLPTPLPEGAWLRLMLTNTAGRVSFAPPEIVGMPGDAVPASPPLLLLAPKGEEPAVGPWRPEVAGPSDWVLRTPGVSFADFEAFAGRAANIAALTDSLPAKLLLALRLARAYFEAEDKDDMTALLDSLPDPMVEGMLVSLDPLDRLDTGTPPQGWSLVAPQVVKITPYQNIKDQVQKVIDAAPAAFEGLARQLIADIHAGARLSFTASVGTQPGLAVAANTRDVTLQVPEGQSASLRACPMVREALFGTLIDPGLRVLSCGTHATTRGTWRLFEGTGITAEAMALPPDAPGVKQAIRIKTEGVSRDHTLTCDLNHLLRPYAEVEIMTQRWRPTGVPILSWCNPAQLATTGPVVDVTDMGEERERFEAEAFIGRGRDDGAATLHRFPAGFGRGNAVPTEHMLKREEGPVRAATWARHRITLRSRYFGAMRRAASGLRPVSKDDWDLAVAVLADISAGQLTRPQVRAFLPLPSRVAEDQRQVAPPVLAILDEPPMAQLGLAERITAEIRTTRRFGFENDVLALTGLRKEIGPDPRLSLQGIADQASHGLAMIAEGPFGLHYEAADTKAPRLVNTQVLLHLHDTVSTQPNDLEESFAGVMLRRLADTGWCWAPSAPKGSDLRMDGPGIALGDTKGPLVTMGNGGTDHVVRIRRSALFGVKSNPDTAVGTPPPAPQEETFVDLCRLSSQTGMKPVAIVRQAHGDQIELCIAAHSTLETVGDMSLGQGLQDHMLASALLSPVGTVTGLETGIATLTSEPTFVEWVRTARDVGRFLVAGTDQPKVMALDDLTARFDKVTDDRHPLHFHQDSQLRLMSPAMGKPHPLGLHRHVAVLATRPALDAGRQRQIFAEARLADFHGGTLLSKPWAQLQLIEIETPARVLLSQGGAGAMQHLQRYEVARFDLAATGARKPWATPDPLAIRLALRAVDRSLAPAETLTFTLTDIDDQTSLSTTQLSVKIPATQAVRGLILQHDGTQWHAWAQGEAGLVSLVVQGAVAPESQGTWFDLTLQTTGGTLWTDISLLHGKDGGADPYPPVDFDWFFGPADSAATLSEAVSPQTLNRLPEAQARIVAISAPQPTLPFAG